MNKPDYFLADLPPETPITPALVTEACQTLRRNGARYLADRSTQEIISLLDRVGRDWLDGEFPLRRETLEHGPKATGFSAPVLAEGLDHFFSQLTADNLELLLEQEFGHARRLDVFSTDHAHRSSIARGPELLGHITAGNLPVPALMSIITGLLCRSAQFVKCATGQSFIPRIFAHSLHQADGKIGACLEIAEWKGGSEPLESALFAEVDCLTATGSDAALESIRKRLPHKTRFLGYGTRVSFGFVTKEILSTGRPDETVHHAAKDIAAWNQLGCLSPHVIYVQTGGVTTPETFAELLAAQLHTVEKTHPRGPLPSSDAAAIAMRRAFYEVRAANSPDTKLWTSPDSTAWTVVFDNDPRFQLSCLNRFIHVKPVTDLAELLREAEPIRQHISTVGLAATSLQTPDLAHQLARWGVTRICPLGRMQKPPLSWRHDGRPALGDLIV